MYQDVETPVAPDIGKINVYKVHHHCSHSTNDTWLVDTQPAGGIISAGNGNGYGHPTADCLERLHTHKVKTYWTETGNGGEPEPGLDVVGGNMIVEGAPHAASFAFGGSEVDSYSIAQFDRQFFPNCPCRLYTKVCLEHEAESLSSGNLPIRGEHRGGKSGERRFSSARQNAP
jgi:hypothetical protein